jgi:hypothetical protein
LWIPNKINIFILDLISSSKESERDMFDQRNQQFQTTIISSSVMFSALSTVIIQGPLSNQASKFLLISYSLTTSLSFAFLFLSIVLCIEITSRASKFMYQRALLQTTQLREAIEVSKRAMDKLRNNMQHNQPMSPSSGVESNCCFSPGSSDCSYKKSSRHLNLITGEDKYIDDKWKRHEEEIFGFLEEREKINENAWISKPESSTGDRSTNDDIDPATMSFEDFWEKRCKVWGEAAIALFYIGSMMFLAGVMIFMYSQFYFVYAALSGALVAEILLGTGLILGIATVLTLRSWRLRLSPGGTRRSRF